MKGPRTAKSIFSFLYLALCLTALAVAIATRHSASEYGKAPVVVKPQKPAQHQDNMG
jgi:hypothetical protein